MGSEIDTDFESEKENVTTTKRKPGYALDIPVVSNLEIPASVQTVFSRIDKAQLLRAKEDINMQLTDIINNVQRIMTRYTHTDLSSSTERRMSFAEYTRKRRTNILEKVATYSKVIDAREKILAYVLAWLEEWNGILSSITAVDIDEHHHWIAQMQMLPEMLKAIENNVKILCRISTTFLEEKRKQKKRTQSRGTLWKSWKERVVKRPATAHALRPDQMISDQYSTNAKVSEIQDMLQELTGTTMFNKLENSAIKYISSTIFNLSKALGMLSDDLKATDFPIGNMYVDEIREADKELSNKIIHDLSEQNEMLQQKLKESEEKFEQLIQSKAIRRQLYTALPTPSTLKVLSELSPQSSMTKVGDMEDTVDSILSKEFENILEESQRKGTKGAGVKRDAALSYTAQVEETPDAALSYTAQVEETPDAALSYTAQVEETPDAALSYTAQVEETPDAPLSYTAQVEETPDAALSYTAQVEETPDAALSYTAQVEETPDAALSYTAQVEETPDAALSYTAQVEETPDAALSYTAQVEETPDAALSYTAQVEETPELTEQPDKDTAGDDISPKEVDDHPDEQTGQHGSQKRRHTKGPHSREVSESNLSDGKGEQKVSEDKLGQQFQPEALEKKRKERKFLSQGKSKPFIEPKSQHFSSTETKSQDGSGTRSTVEQVRKVKPEQVLEKASISSEIKSDSSSESGGKEIKSKKSKSTEATLFKDDFTSEPQKVETKGRKPQIFPGRSTSKEGTIVEKEMLSFIKQTQPQQPIKSHSKTTKEELGSPGGKSQQGNLELFQKAILAFLKEKIDNTGKPFGKESVLKEERLLKKEEVEKLGIIKAKTEEYFRKVAETVTKILRKYKNIKNEGQVEEKSLKQKKVVSFMPELHIQKSESTSAKSEISSILENESTDPIINNLIQMIVTELERERDVPTVLEREDHKEKGKKKQRDFLPEDQEKISGMREPQKPKQWQEEEVGKDRQKNRTQKWIEQDGKENQRKREKEEQQQTRQQQLEPRKQMMKEREVPLEKSEETMGQIQKEEGLQELAITGEKQSRGTEDFKKQRQNKEKDKIEKKKSVELIQIAAQSPVTSSPRRRKSLKYESQLYEEQNIQRNLETLESLPQEESSIPVTPPTSARSSQTSTLPASEVSLSGYTTLTPEQAQNLGITLSPEQLQALGMTLTLDQAQDLGITLTPQQAQELGIILTPQQAEAQRITLTPQQAQALGITLTPQQAQAQGITLTPQQAQELGITLTPQQAEAQGITLIPHQAQELGITLTPRLAQELGITLTPQQAQAQGITLTPQQAQALGITLTPQQAQSQGITLTPQQAQSQGITLTPQQAQAQGITLTPQQAQAQGITLTPQQAHDLGITLTPQQAQELGITLTPQQAEAQGITLIPQQAQELGITLTPRQAQELGITLTPQQAHDLGITLTPQQAEAQRITLTPQQAQAQRITLTPQQTHDLGAQGITLTPQQAQDLGITLTPQQAETQGITLTPQQAQALGITLTPQQVQAQGITLTPQQAHDLGITLTPQQAESQGITLTPQQTQDLGITLTPLQAQELGITLTPQQAQELGITLTPQQAEAQWITLTAQQVHDLGITLTPQEVQALGITLTPQQAHDLGITLTPQEAEAQGITLTPQQALDLGITLTPQQAQAQGITLTPQQAQELGITLTPQQAQAQGITLTPQQAQELGITLTPQQAQAQGITLTPQQAQELGITVTPQQAEAQGITLTPQQAQELGIILTPQQAEAQWITLTPQQAQALGITLTPQQAQELGITLTLQQVQAQGITLTPQQAQELGITLTPQQAEAQGITLTPHQTQAQGITLTPQQTHDLGAQGITLTPQQAQELGITLTPQQAEAQGITLTPQQAQELGITLTPHQTQIQGISLSQQTQAQEVTLTTEQAQLQGVTLTPQQAQDLGISFSLQQAQAPVITLSPQLVQVLRATLTPEQVQALLPPFPSGQIQSLQGLLPPEQVQVSVIPEEAHSLGITLTHGEAQTVGITRTQELAQALELPLTEEQARKLGVSITLEKFQGASNIISLEQFHALRVTPSHQLAQALGTPLTLEKHATLAPSTLRPFHKLKASFPTKHSVPSKLSPSPWQSLTSSAPGKGQRRHISSGPGKLLAPLILPTSRKILVVEGQSIPAQSAAPEILLTPGQPVSRVPPTPGQPLKLEALSSRQLFISRGLLTPRPPLIPQVPVTPRRPLISRLPFTFGQIPRLQDPLSPGKPLVPEASSTPRELQESRPGLFEQPQAIRPPATPEPSSYLQTPSPFGQQLAPWIIPGQVSPLWVPPTPRHPSTHWPPRVPEKPQGVLSSSVAQKRSAIISSLKSKPALVHPSSPHSKVSQAPFITKKAQMSEVSDTSEKSKMFQDTSAMEPFEAFQSYLTNDRMPVSQTPYIDGQALPPLMKPQTSLPSLITQLPKISQILPSEWDQNSRFPPIDKPWILTSVSGIKKPKMTVPPSSPQELEEKRYIVDVEAQRKNLILLNQATKTSGLPLQQHTTAMNLIIETLHMNNVRLGYLFRKYIAYRLIQRARHNIIKQLKTIQNTGKGYEMQNLYIMLSRIDDYQKKVMQVWTEKQKSLEQKRSQCLRNMMSLFSQLQEKYKLNLSLPTPSITDKNQIPTYTEFNQRPLIELLSEEDKKSEVSKKFRQEDQMKTIWHANLSTSSYPITEKTSIHSLWAQLGGYPDIPRLLQLDIQSTFRKSLASIQSRSKKIPKPL